MLLNGALVIDKPAGPTSHDVVARLRRVLREKRIGHTGTLDPLATGVLALLIGRATRLSQFLVTDEKEYVADVRLGVATATYDAEGLESAQMSDAPPPTPEAVETALSKFRGTFLQTPPPYSAKKVQGTRSYELARRDSAVALRPVEVTVRVLEQVRSEDPMLLRLRLVCTSGFYVRTLAHELGHGLGCGAHLERLRRTRAGQFTIDRAVALDAAERDPVGTAQSVLPIDDLLGHLPAVILPEEDCRRVEHGNAVVAGALPQETAENPARVRLVNASGQLLAVAERRPGGTLHPVVVLR